MLVLRICLLGVLFCIPAHLLGNEGTASIQYGRTYGLLIANTGRPVAYVFS